jgi:uncharacterized protein YjbJ (UPF0337 family)
MVSALIALSKWYQPIIRRNPMSDGTTDKIKGRVKEAVGALTDDKRLKKEGKIDQASGTIKDGVEKAVDKVRGVASPKQ